MKDGWKYRAGDLLAGAIIGAVVALAHHFLVPESLGMAAGALLGMFVGMGAQMLISVPLGSLLGSVEVMVPGMFVGMLAMVPPPFRVHSLQAEIYLGVGIGILIFLAFAVWDAKLQGTVQTVRDPAEPKTSLVRSSAWNGPPRLYDWMEQAANRRRVPFQRELFQAMKGRVLFVAAGTGLNFSCFPAGKQIWAIDLSSRMLRAARARAASYDGAISLSNADVERLPFADESFDTAATASTFCSVADPVQGLKELYRVLKPAGRLLMFEHVRSRNRLVGLELDLLSLATRYMGPAMNRRTVDNVQRAGFVVDRVVCAYLDVFVAIEAHRRPRRWQGQPNETCETRPEPEKAGTAERQPQDLAACVGGCSFAAGAGRDHSVVHSFGGYARHSSGRRQ
ncbi:MAG: class I SAM-dependent methyltransferase [Acidobacteria bacterium]|nr:class I SAM-dependent methyltransferase [Acidobacteriota bacterium]